MGELTCATSQYLHPVLGRLSEHTYSFELDFNVASVRRHYYCSHCGRCNLYCEEKCKFGTADVKERQHAVLTE